jgi:hypothetical protein
MTVHFKVYDTKKLHLKIIQKWKAISSTFLVYSGNLYLKGITAFELSHLMNAALICSNSG